MIKRLATRAKEARKLGIKQKYIEEILKKSLTELNDIISEKKAENKKELKIAIPKLKKTSVINPEDWDDFVKEIIKETAKNGVINGHTA